MRSRPVSSIRTLGWPAWGATVLLFALLCAIVAYWAVTLLAPRAPIAPHTGATGGDALPRLQQASQLFGTSQPVAQPAQLANVQVVGIVAAGIRGSAILAIDGKPAKTYAVGEAITPSQRVVAVRADAVVIGTDAGRVELAAPSGASLAVLSSGADQPRRASDPALQAPAPSGSPIPGLPLAPPSGVPGFTPGIVPAPVSGAAPAGIVPIAPDASGAAASAAAAGSPEPLVKPRN